MAKGTGIAPSIPRARDDRDPALLEDRFHAGFKAGVSDGHHFQNRSTNDAVLLVVGSRSDEDEGAYSDIDLFVPAGHYSGPLTWHHKDGTPY